MIELRAEYESCFSDDRFLPEIGQLTQDAGMLAYLIDDIFNGKGVAVVVCWARLCHGHPIMFRRVRGEIGEYVIPSDLPGKILPMLAAAADDLINGKGPELVYRICCILNGGYAVLRASLVMEVRDRWVLYRYGLGDVTRWQLASAVGVDPRKIDHILDGPPPKKHDNQLLLFDT